MEVVEQTHSRTHPLREKFVRDGVAGNYEVIYEMIRIIRESVDKDQSINALSASILIDKGLDSYSSNHQILSAVYDYVKNHVIYIQDIAGNIESLKSARITLSDGYGDCDDHTNTNCTILGCLGFEEVKIAMAKYSKLENGFSHVYCVVYKDGERFVLDTTLPDAGFNEEVDAAEVQEIGVFSEVPGLDGLSGLANNLKYLFKKFGKASITAVPTIAGVMPIGFVAGNALATGASLLTGQNSDKLSIPATASKINQELDSIISDLLVSRIALDAAKTQAVQAAGQMSLLTPSVYDHYAYVTAKDSVKAKLEFINNFESYAAANDIKVVHLDSRLMLAAGLGGAAFGVYAIYKFVKREF